MINIIKYHKYLKIHEMFFLNKKEFTLLKRYYSKCKRYKHSAQIRNDFLDFFIKDNDHVFVKSSPVVPYCDSSIPFVSAGMNQFKGIFLNQRVPPANKVANSQKCVRVGGKHSDLEIVGTDGYHHTFFEMLGNWSFGSYFKKEACELAWTLLTGPYNLKPSSLYVTYFKGDKNLNIDADLEVADIWRSLGVPKENILPFGSEHNFWEMGLTGPCGPCTEIHYDHTNSSNRAMDVNKDLPNLTELWNIVFIQYNRENDNTVSKLHQQYVDTGMGFERLTAILQGKNSNYETDLFMPLFERIHRINKSVLNYRSTYGNQDINGLDTAYRIIADHARMAAICLADRMITEENYKLRKVIRKAMVLSNKYFTTEKGFLWHVCEGVIEILGETYPELATNKNQIKNILMYEEEILKALRMEKYPEWTELVIKNPALEMFDIAEIPNIVFGYRELFKQCETLKIKQINSDLAFKLYDTYGLDKSKMTELAKVFNMSIDLNGFTKKLSLVRKNSKIHELIDDLELSNLNLKATNDSSKYCYHADENNYIFKQCDGKLLKILKDNAFLDEINTNDYCSLIFDRTCFYSTAGGQENDVGKIVFKNGIQFNVEDVYKINNILLHSGTFLNKNLILKSNEIATLTVNHDHRLANMRNHTATHILNSVLKKILRDSTVCQKSSKVTAKDLKFDIFVFGNAKLTSENIEEIEKNVKKVVSSDIQVQTDIVEEEALIATKDITLVPGEIYPIKGIRLIEISNEDFHSKEACCGTHVKNTSHIAEFCITSCKPNGRSAYSLKAVTGERAKLANSNGKYLENIVNDVLLNLQKNKLSINEINLEIKNISQKLNNFLNTDLLPYTVQLKCISEVKKLKNLVKSIEEKDTRNSVLSEMTAVLKNCKQPWIVHELKTDSTVVKIHEVAQLCSHLPALVIVNNNGSVRARCCVPESISCEEFNVEKWLQSFNNIFNGTLIKSIQIEEDSIHVCDMKMVKVKRDQIETKMKLALSEANKFAKKYFTKRKLNKLSENT